MWAIVIASSLLTVINYYSLKITSSLRAYVNGESRYSKGQKDGSRHLVTYLRLHDETYWNRFQEEIKVPIGDSLARVGLTYDSSYEFIKKGFLQGKNHPDDINDMIWLFRNFQHTYFMEEPIHIWKEADVLIGELKTLGDSLRHRVKTGMTQQEKDEVTLQIDRITTQLTVSERAFSDLMGVNARIINELLFVINLTVTLLIISGVVSYAYKGYKRLVEAKNDLKKSNSNLVMINQDLDNFIYAASHDLKSPINNLEGLILLFKTEANLDSAGHELLHNMDLSIVRLRKTITALTDVVRAEKSPLDDVSVNSFASILEEFKQENEYLLMEADVRIETDFRVREVTYSRNGLKSIIHNLLTNAVKYRSAERLCVISIKSYSENDHVVLSVSDNGLGMDLERHGNKLFKMFHRLHDHVEGTGVGLYMIKRIVEKHGGNISVQSEINKGTEFCLTLN